MDYVVHTSDVGSGRRYRERFTELELTQLVLAGKDPRAEAYHLSCVCSRLFRSKCSICGGRGEFWARTIFTR